METEPIAAVVVLMYRETHYRRETEIAPSTTFDGKMKIPAPFGRRKFRSLKYKRTIVCLQSFFIVISCCFGFIGLSLFSLHSHTIGYDQHSTGVDNVLTAYESKLIHRSKEQIESSVAMSSIYSHNYKFADRKSSFGFVMSEFACRVLSRHITSSNMLVITPGAVSAAKEAFELKATKEMNTSNILPQKLSVGVAFLHYGASEGHAIHAINSYPEEESEAGKSGPTLDAWWKAFDLGEKSNDESKGWWSTEPIEKPHWILLAVFDSDIGSENNIWSEAESFLEGCTVTYFIIAVHSIRRNDGFYEFGGMNAIDSLLYKKYKLQTLSTSHYYAHTNNEREILERYGPNALFKSAEEIRGFLKWGADAAQRYGKATENFFTSYIFATQGLDLAIPTPQHYLRDAGTPIDVFNKRLMDNLPPLKTCPKTNSNKLNFVFNKVS